MNFDPQTIGTLQSYRLMIGSVVPRPIAWISTLSDSGVLNLAPYSFFTVASCNPPVLAVTQVNPRERPAKDTLTNLRATGECVVNIVSEQLAEMMNASCADYPATVSEFDILGIERQASYRVAVAGVKAAKVRFECNLREIIEISALPMGGTMMLLNVVNIYVDESILSEDQIAPQLLNAIGKMGGDLYATTHAGFELARPILDK
jgi:flavin reductase (DIM6/NTAB) family NADH-FMN oxidoreductase RutF